jgi:hypothetical protein
MFILRKINQQGIQSNLCIGSNYCLIREEDTEEFNKTLDIEYYFKSLRDDIYAFISYNDSREVLPLYKSQENYIMTGEGNTFSNVTFKK